MSIALFPGQGVQSAGMDGGLHEGASDVFTLASEVLAVDVVELCSTGRSGEADLTSTRWAQPAVVVCSVAAYRSLGEDFAAAVGHSIGEYAALVSAGALDLTDAIRLVALRAKVTEEAGAANPGAMAAVMKVEREVVDRVCAATGVALAADNSSGQYVISGANDVIDDALKAFGETKAIARKLEVSAAFHSPVMASACEPLRAALADVSFSPPAIEFWSPTTATPLTDPEAIRAALVDQLVSPVRWRETVESASAKHGTSFVDVGPGKIVGALAKRIVQGAEISYATDLLGASA